VGSREWERKKGLLRLAFSHSPLPTPLFNVGLRYSTRAGRLAYSAIDDRVPGR
jgi:hypothetical protein